MVDLIRYAIHGDDFNVSRVATKGTRNRPPGNASQANLKILFRKAEEFTYEGCVIQITRDAVPNLVLLHVALWWRGVLLFNGERGQQGPAACETVCVCVCVCVCVYLCLRLRLLNVVIRYKVFNTFASAPTAEEFPDYPLIVVRVNTLQHLLGI